MRVITEKQITESAFHIGKISHALLSDNDIERLDAVENLAELAYIIGGMRLLKVCGGIKQNEK